MMNDTYRHKGLRKQLVETIRSKGIRDERILEAIGKIPRHLFMDSGFISFSYKDQAFPIGEGQTISQPYTVAFQTQLLEIKPTDRVLEIGTGSGYQTAVLIELGVFAGMSGLGLEIIFAGPIPIGEIAVSIWLIAKGFNPSAITPESAG